VITTPPIAATTLASQARRAVRESVDALLDRQGEDGHWQARVDSDPSVTAQYLLTAGFVGRVDPEIETPMLEYLRQSQLPEGGWPAYPGGPASLDVSLLCYAALKLGGYPAESPELARARRMILAAGGLEMVGFIPRAALAIWNQIPYESLTYVSPKFLLIPPAISPNLRDLGILLQAALPVWLLSKRRVLRTRFTGLDLAELYTGGRFPRLSMRVTDLAVSAASRLMDSLWPAPGVDRRAVDWLAERQNADGLWTGLALFTNRGLMALETLDPGRYASAIDAGMAGLARLHVSEGRMRWQQVGYSPVLDTAISVRSLIDAGIRADDPRLRAAFDWLIETQSRRRGDWQQNAPGVEPGGWSFIPENNRNADTDTTLHVLEVLALAPPDVAGRSEALARGVQWLLGMQNRDGSWGMFGRQPVWRLALPRELERNGVMDRGVPDVTARVIRALSRLEALSGVDVGAAMTRGRRFLTATQGADGSWPGRWAVNYTYGTAQGLTALAGTGEAGRAGRARAFLTATQHADGGWGESPESYAAGRFVSAPSTVTQTGLVQLALLTAVPPDDPTLVAGMRFLLDRRPSGGGLWTEDTFCQVVLPGRLYFQNTLLAGCFGLMAVSRHLRQMGALAEAPA